MSGIGTTELILIFAVALVIFGPSKLPELGKLAGRSIGSLKRYTSSIEKDLESGDLFGSEEAVEREST